ncbi:MAG TPA: cell division protein FtsZ [Prolixibacteraceae bacterium]|nr:cell division protein FtsZ [Prolixibacteraceae bacterium]
MADLIEFDLPVSSDKIIKVIGVGGGGGNAVNHMYRQGIKDVEFAVCNTDAQALMNSPVPLKVQLGSELTEGRGAGNKPDVGRESALENIEDIEKLLDGNTKMVFITAGMGGGTGTGAAPVIAQVARDRKILTVGIVSIPFRNEGRLRIQQAIEGIREMESHVDSLLVINNERIREIYGDFPISKAFSKADDVLAIAAKGIAEIITCPGFINVDFEDVRTVMSNSGVAIMGSFMAVGENRARKAVEGAVNSPLLNNNDIRGAKNILVNITSGETNEVTMDEMNLVNEYVQEMAGNNADLIYGVAVDPEMGEAISVTVIATGFKSSSIPEMNGGTQPQREKVPLLDDTNAFPAGFFGNENVPNQPKHPVFTEPMTVDKKDEIIKQLYPPIRIDPFGDGTGEGGKKVMQVNFFNETEDYIEELSKIPAYERRKAKNPGNPLANAKEVSRYTLSGNPDEGPRLRKNNSFLHDKAD